jgi:hypothetical protein
MSTTAKQTRRPAAKRPHRVGLRKNLAVQTTAARRAMAAASMAKILAKHSATFAALAK